MYRALISSVGSCPSRELLALQRSIVDQFRHSPYCSTVLVEGDAPHEPLSDEARHKVEYNVHDERLRDSTSARTVVVQFSGQSELSKLLRDVKVDSWNEVQPIRDPYPTSYQIQNLTTLRKLNPVVRFSVFRFGRLVLPVTERKSPLKDGLDRMTLMDSLYSIYAQFLPVRYRELPSDQLAQAVRLNYETCAGMSSINNSSMS